MPSSLIFAALAAAWLVVLVPMFARRRQEVSRTTDSALAARVVRRGSARHPASSGAPSTDRLEEATAMPDTDREGTGVNDVDYESEFDDDYYEDGEWRRVHSDDVRAGRRYRPGRGGFDPEAAAQAARAKYARRQRIVLFMLLAALTTGLVAGFLSPVVWWGHAGVDLVLIGYLTYLRRQVRIEEEIRRRRLARMSAAWDEEAEAYEDEEPLPEPEVAEDYDDEVEEDHRSARRAAPQPTMANAVVVELDDEDPMFDELDERTWEPYRRAVGE